MSRFAVVVGVLLGCWQVAAGQTFLGKDVPQWQGELTKKDEAARRNAAFALGKIGRDAEEATGALSAA